MMVGIGPVNTAGQATRLAAALRRSGVPAESWSPRPHRLGFPVDRLGPMGRYSHVVSWTGVPVRHPRVADAFQGSELRVPSMHRALEPWSPFGDDDFTHELERRLRTQRDVPTFVATMELLDYAPGAKWIPIIAEPIAGGPLLAGRPRALFAPSNGVLKGAACVDALDVPEVDLIRPAWMPPSDFLALLASVDVVIGGLVLGDYGGTEIQGMAAGRVVVGNVSPRVRSRLPEACPIVQADPSTLAGVLRDIAARPEHYRTIAAEGPGYAGRWHDGRQSVAALGEFLGTGP